MNENQIKTVVFVSNFFNHHQKPFSDAMFKLTNGNYTFIATKEMREERKKLGWRMDDIPPYVFCNYTSDENRVISQQKIDEADVVIVGSAPNALIKKRLSKGKLTFRYSERINKVPVSFAKNIARIPLYFFKHTVHKNLYMLCASAYTAADYAESFAFLSKTYKWGYFPEIKRYNDIGCLINAKKPASILWTSRFIGWKHPEIPVCIAKRLKSEGYSFELNLIGNGELQTKIENMIKEENLTDCVNLLGAMKPEQVREYMENSEIFLFTSDRKEGWGAVLNESMNSGCAVVASHEIGAVPFLVKDGQNGLVYRDGDLDDIYSKVKFLLENDMKRREIGKKAYETIQNTWNAEVAAERFLALSQCLVEGKMSLSLYEDGPCSRADVLKDNWYL